jgi:hypothetical protein
MNQKILNVNLIQVIYLGLAMVKIKKNSNEDIAGFYGGEIYFQNNIKL